MTSSARIISIHAPHTRSDVSGSETKVIIDISIHAPHTRSDNRAEIGRGRRQAISIHAPHTRSDKHAFRAVLNRKYFNPRSSYEERPHWPESFEPDKHFNPRSSYEERPVTVNDFVDRSEDFNPRSSYEERRQAQDSCRHAAISIHAPHTRSDVPSYNRTQPRERFQSTLLIRGATHGGFYPGRVQRISIHAPHTRSDIKCHEHVKVKVISIHAPHTRSDMIFLIHY